MEKLRFDRIEDRVEKMDDKIDHIKDELYGLKSDFKIFSHKIERHVAGDEKIITEIQPTLNDFRDFIRNDLPIIKELAKKELVKNEIDKMTTKKLHNWKLILGVVAAATSIVGGVVYKLFQIGVIKF